MGGAFGHARLDLSDCSGLLYSVDLAWVAGSSSCFARNKRIPQRGIARRMRRQSPNRNAADDLSQPELDATQIKARDQIPFESRRFSSDRSPPAFSTVSKPLLRPWGELVFW